MIGALIGLAGGLLGARSQKRANDKNVKATRQANAANIASAERLNMLNIREARRAEGVNIAQTLAAEARADARHEAAKAYADPKAERARLEAAGLNPASFLQNNAPAQGSAIAANSAPLPRLSMASAQAANVAAVDGFANSISQVGQLMDQRDTLKMQNTWLNERLNKRIVQPNVGGVYERKQYAKNSYSGTSSNSRNTDGPVPAGRDLLVTGKTWAANPAYSDAEELERRYGDVGSSIAGIGIGIADAGFNNYLLKRKNEGVIDLSFLRDEYSRKGIRPRARQNRGKFSSAPSVKTTPLPNLSKYRTPASFRGMGPRIHWYN